MLRPLPLSELVGQFSTYYPYPIWSDNLCTKLEDWKSKYGSKGKKESSGFNPRPKPVHMLRSDSGGDQLQTRLDTRVFILERCPHSEDKCQIDISCIIINTRPTSRSIFIVVAIVALLDSLPEKKCACVCARARNDAIVCVLYIEIILSQIVLCTLNTKDNNTYACRYRTHSPARTDSQP